MKIILKRKNQILFAAISGILSTASMTDANASGAYKEIESALDHSGFVVGAWANAGVTYNGNEPENNFNGPVTFGDRAAEFQVNQLNVYLQRAVATEGSKFDLGGRFDFMYGTDSIFTQAYGVPSFDVNSAAALQRSDWDLSMLGSNSNRFYDIALPQAYLESYVPVGTGLNLKVGHFYTPIGYETVPAPDNFFYTHAYTMQYGEPFTHTGILGNYNVDSNWALMGGLLTGSATGGWDGGWDRQLGNWSGIMGATYTTDDKATSLNIAGTYGDTSETSKATWALYSIVLKHNINEKTHLVLQHDHGFADNTYNYATSTPNSVDAEWYGVNSHLYYDISDKVVAGIRAEWFRDQNGLRVCSPGRIGAATDNQGVSYAAAGQYLSSCAPATYYEFTAGVTWKPKEWLRLRPNVRYDIVGDSHGYSPFVIRGNSFATTPGNNVTDQITFSTDVTVTF
jgi:hypothetical protein